MMLKVIGSKLNLMCEETHNAYEFMDCIKDLYFNSRVQKLDQWEQHNHTSRLQHSLNVAYYSYVICKALGWDYRSAARAAVLHDMYFYNWRKKNVLRKANHSLWHPLVAADNAKKITKLNKIEEDAIKKHMWPCTPVPPKYKESYVVNAADKICATMEFIDGIKAVKKTVSFVSRFVQQKA